MKIRQYLKEAGFISAYWITPQGKVLDCGAKTHIDYICAAPEKFGLRRQDVEAMYAKHGEPYGFEGYAREDVIIAALEKGFIRLRKYRDLWSATIWEWNRRKAKLLSNWAYGMLNGEYGAIEKDKWIPVKIAVIKGSPPAVEYDISDLSTLHELRFLEMTTLNEMENLI